MKLYVSPSMFKQINENLVKESDERTPIYYSTGKGILKLGMVHKNVEYYSESSVDLLETNEVKQMLTKENSLQVLDIMDTNRGE